MSTGFELTVEQRDVKGKGASRRLRRLEDKVPAIIYGAGKTPATICLNHNDFMHHLENEAFYSHILTLKVDGKKEKVVLKALQRHPYKRQIMHADFLRVSATEAITMKVPFHFVGEEDAPGVKTNDGVFSHLMTDVEIKCLPGDLPEFIEIDVSKMELDDTIHLSHVTKPKGVEFLILSHDDDNDPGVISCHIAKEQPIEEEETPVEGEEGEAEAGEEGGESAEGDDAAGDTEE